MAEPTVSPAEVRPVSGTSVVDLLDRVVNTGVVLTGDAVISLAGVDLIRLDLRLLLVAVDTAARLEEST
ncbi:MAG TPA: gas vesicle protein GvpJ [Pseudonocardiaceae bacterium]|nr:gas vesicle protein GvpJ [Pseudonocardiaceae bacterium]